MLASLPVYSLYALIQPDILGTTINLAVLSCLFKESLMYFKMLAGKINTIELLIHSFQMDSLTAVPPHLILKGAQHITAQHTTHQRTHP